MEAGRSRGRARTGGGESDEPEVVGPEGESALRGRGGFRAAEILRTIPSGVTNPHGELGSIKVITNYFRLKVPDDQIIFGYRVDFEPQVESVRVRRGLIYGLQDIFDKAYVFDGGNEIKSLSKIDDKTTEGTKRDGSTIKITIKRTATIGWGHPEMLRLYNTQMRRNLSHLGFIQIGRDFYDESARKRLTDYEIEVWPGILTAINEHDGGILMVCDLINKIIRRETALDMLKRYREQDRDGFREVARKDLPGKIVMTRYNNKTYRIDDLLWEHNPITYTFDRRGTSISLKDYYQEQYNIEITDERQPLLLVQPSEKAIRGGDSKKIMLVPELCVMTGLTELMNRDFTFKKALDEHTKFPPTKKAQALLGFVRKMRDNETVRNEMAAWQMSYEDKLVDTMARNLPGEKIQTFGESGEAAGATYYQAGGNFEKDIRSKKMKKAVKLENWALIGLKRDKSVIDEFFGALRRVCIPLGVEIDPPRIFPIDNDRVSTYLECCRTIPEAARLVIIVVPNNNAERYSAIKKYFCCDAPCPTQVITSRLLGNKKNLMSVTTKILIQMSTKLGAEPWGIFIPPKNTMVIGYDTYHDSERRGASVGGFVCSTNGTATSWFSRTTYHTNKDELSLNFSQNFRVGLKNWQRVNNCWPARIVVYRDGVSEGQIPHVYNVELKQLEAVLAEREDLSKCLFTFIIVTKRVNARFFLDEGRILANPPPGTVIDSVITRKERYDFYLISQSVRQGTVNPTMYNIIADTTTWKAHHHQQMAYKMCHLYYNWAGTLSVPAPCQYAHKLAHLTGTALHADPHPALAHTLFFL